MQDTGTASENAEANLQAACVVIASLYVTSPSNWMKQRHIYSL